ncbi:hypothetical protein HELRODRAFT_171779 [Helobdella robusta]|uniref:Uncharacterized protein n=1 Tax=Helobdella robusta TaxID=6412 RepID=T1F4N7_HELRO|nr:hypothetical protein HELRODRAFT_171779 [Helobdella robusta]ESO05388.1 hypothetical protein HELRODRAFT_171779 [Helobdella robusta]
MVQEDEEVEHSSSSGDHGESLHREAAKVLWDLAGLGYQELVAKLENRYRTSGHEESYKYELQTLRRKPVKVGDTFDERCFLSAINDTDLKLKVREREPRNIDDSLKIAQRLEVSKNLVNSFYKFIPKVRNMQDTTEDRIHPAVERQMKSLRQSLDVLADHGQHNTLRYSSRPSPNDGKLQLQRITNLLINNGHEKFAINKILQSKEEQQSNDINNNSRSDRTNVILY